MRKRQIGRDDRVGRRRHDRKVAQGQCILADDVVALQEPHLVQRQKGLGQKPEECRLDARKAEWNGQQDAFAAGFFQNQLQNLLEGHDRGPAQLVGLRGRGRIPKNARNRQSDIADEDGLKTPLESRVRSSGSTGEACKPGESC